MLLRTLARCLTIVVVFCTLAPPVLTAHAADKSSMAVTLARQASKSFETGDFARASELYLAAWRTDPNPDFLFGAARSAHLGSLTDKATELYRQFLATEGADGDRKRRAQEYLNELDRAKVQSRVAEAERVMHDDPKLASGLYLDAFRMAPKQHELLFKAAVAEQAANDTAAAEQHLREYLNAAPQDAPDRHQAQARLDSLVRKANPPAEVVTPVKPTPEVRPADKPLESKGADTGVGHGVQKPAPELGRPRWPGWALVGGGAAVAIAGLAVYAATTSDASALKAQLTPDASGQVTAISQEEAKAQASSINARIGTGWALAGVGLAATGLGVWWLLTTPEPAAARTSTADPGIRTLTVPTTLTLGPGPGTAGMSMALRF